MQGTGRPEKTYSPPSSDELIEIFSRTGRPEDFEQIVRRFAALVLCNCRRVTGNAHDAEDASQLVFLALAMEIKSGKTIHRLGPWLQRVANRQSLKIVRSRGRRQKRENAVRKSEMHLVDPDAPMDATVTAGIVRDAIDQLPERYRLPVILHYFGGMSLDAIAVELKMKRQAVGTRLFRGRKMLGARLGAHGVKLDEHALSAALMVLVPGAVIAGVVRSVTDMSAPMAAASSVLPVGGIIRALALAVAQRPMRIAAIGLVLLCGGSGMAWVTGAKALDLRKLRIDPIGWLQRLLQFRPRPMLTDSATPVESHEAQEAVEQLLPPTPRIETFLKSLPPPIIQSHQYVSTSAIAPKVPERPRVEPVKLNQTFALVTPTQQTLPDSLIRKLQPSSPTPSLRVDVGAAVDQKADRLDVGVATEETLTVASKDMHVSQLRLGVMPSGNGTFIQSGGRVIAERMVVGDKGRGAYELHHGRIEAGEITIGASAGSHGELDVGDGEVVMTDPAGDLTVGLRGSGRMMVGTQFAPGQVSAAMTTAARVPIVVRGTVEANGLLQGWGNVGTGGELINNGQVIADGFNRSRTLNLSSFSRVVNTIDNVPGGQNGWYVQRGGRLELPKFALQPGTYTYTWGESEHDQTLDLVNSLRLQVRDQQRSGNLSVTLRTVALADPLDVSLPAQMSVVGFWQFDAQDFLASDVDVLVRYNDRAANSYFFGERELQLMAYDGGEWRTAGSMWRDGTSKWIGGDFDGTFKYLVVGVPWNIYLSSPASNLLDNSVVPEPGAAALSLLASSLLLRRRRRQVQ